MYVKMRAELSGLRNGQPWPPVGGTIELPDDEAATMCANGTAYPVYDPERDVQTAVLPGEETRDVTVDSTGSFDTSARDALVKTTSRKPRSK